MKKVERNDDDSTAGRGGIVSKLTPDSKGGKWVLYIFLAILAVIAIFSII